LEVATQLKVLVTLVESPKFKDTPEQIELVFAEVIVGKGFTVIETVCGVPMHDPVTVIGVTV
jgi:hypothetical protein